MGDERTIFLEALEKRSPQERAAFLDQACGGDASLRARVEELMAAHERAGSFLESPPPGVTLIPDGGGASGVAHASALLGERAGATIGPYRLIEQIGEGGMGVVFMAEQLRPVRRKVALKIVKPGLDTKEVIARFGAERQALAMMDHPNIAKVFDAGSTDTGRPYFVMELVRGVPITQYCDEQKLAPRQRLELFAQVCHAVQHAHTKGVIHRDLKPTNVLVTLNDGDRPVPKVIDFGIAKATAGQRLTEQTLFTEFRQLVGTPLYMSPEQAEMSALLDVDTRSDVYSLGVLLYELLTGTTPFDRQRLAKAAYDEVRRIIREEEPPRPSTRISTLGETLASVSAQRHTEPKRLGQLVRGELDWIVMRALEKDRARRYETAIGLAQDVERYLADQPVEACPPSRTYRMRKFVRRNKAVMTTTALITAVLVLATGVSLWQAVRATRAEHAALAAESVAQRERDEAKRQRKAVELANASMAAVNAFLTEDLLGAATPEVARGHEITVREAVDNAASAVAEKLAGQPLTEAAVRYALAATYWAIGRSELALPHAQTALKRRSNDLGHDHPATIQSERQVGTLLRSLGRRDEAEAYLRSAMERARRVLGAEHPETIKSMQSWADFLVGSGKEAEAASLYQVLLEVHQRLYGEEDRRTLAAKYNGVRLHLRRYANASHDSVTPAREMLDRARKELGDDHPQTVLAMMDFCWVLITTWKHKEAEPHIREALANAKVIFGEDHPHTLKAFKTLARMHSHGFQYAPAAQILVELLDRSRRSLGHDHPFTISVMGDLAAARRHLGMLDEAESLYRQVLQRDRDIQPLCGLAAVAIAQGRASEAETLRREALEHCEKRLSNNDADQVSVMVAVVNGVEYYDLNTVEAEPLRRLIIDASRRVYGDAHLNTLTAVRALENLYDRLGQYERFEPWLHERLERGRRVFGPDVRQTLWSVSELARIHEIQGRLAEAEPLRRHVLEVRRRTLEEKDPQRILAAAAMGALLDRQGRLSEADEVFREVFGARARGSLLGTVAKGRIDRAVELARALVDHDSIDSQDLLSWGEYRLLGGSVDVACELLSRPIAMKGPDHVHRKALGWALLRAKQIAAAHESLRAALGDFDPRNLPSTADPDHWTAAFLLGAVGPDKFSGRWAGTQSAPLPWFFIGQKAEIDGDPAMAAACYQKSIDAGQSSPAPHTTARWADYCLRQLAASTGSADSSVAPVP